jgi:hypothetical protein
VLLLVDYTGLRERRWIGKLIVLGLRLVPTAAYRE